MGFRKEEQKVTEEVKENTKVEETKKEEEEEENIQLIEDLDVQDTIDSINHKKEEFDNYQKKWRTYGIINTIIFLLFVTGGFVLVVAFSKDTNLAWLTYVGLGLVIVGFAFSLVYSKIKKNKLNEKSAEYIDFYFKEKTKVIFNIDGVSKISAKAKCNYKDEFLASKFYKEIQTVRSRFGIDFKYKNVNCNINETAGCKLINKRAFPVFLGKFFYCDVKYDKPTRILFQLKGKELSQPVDNIDNLEIKEDNDKYIIYSNDDDYKKVFNNEVIRSINQFKSIGSIIDVILSISENKLYIGIDYTDEFMNASINEKLTLDILSKEKNDLEKILNIVEQFK